MRESKFRAWDKVTKRYYVVSGLEYDESGELCEIYLAGIEIDESDPNANVRKPSEVILEQDTGLKDQNGKEICEGDIVQCGAYKGKVHYSVGVACYCVGDYTPIYQISRIENESFITLKVISNIHENPELIGEEGYMQKE